MSALGQLRNLSTHIIVILLVRNLSHTNIERTSENHRRERQLKQRPN